VVARCSVKEKKSANESGRRLVALIFQVPFEVFTPYLYVAPELYRGYLPAPYVPIDPALAYPKLLADLWDREEKEEAFLLVEPEGAPASVLAL
jgi:hypothetical protein